MYRGLTQFAPLKLVVASPKRNLASAALSLMLSVRNLECMPVSAMALKLETELVR